MEFLIIALMLACGALFTGFEMAIAAISRAKLLVLVNQKKHGANDALFLKDNIEATLAGCQIAITLFGMIAAATGGAGVADSFSPYLQQTFGISGLIAKVISIICLVVPLSFLTIIFSELVPKVFALGNKEWVCLVFAPWLRRIFRAMSMILRLFSKIVSLVVANMNQKDLVDVNADGQIGLYELRAAVNIARTEKLIGAQEEKIVLAAALLSKRKIKDIMIPATDISSIPQEATLTDALIRAHMDMHTRFPVTGKEADPQTIQGYITFKDIVNALKMSPADPSVKGITRSIRSFSEEETISSTLERMIKEKEHIALVKDLERKTAGMVTLEDILEELVGEIEDEVDRLPIYIHPYGAQWLVGGGALMKNVGVNLEMEFPPDEADKTLAQWCAMKSGRPITGGEIIDTGRLTVLVRKIRRKKLAEGIVGKSVK
jgi:putative hemolysin